MTQPNDTGATDDQGDEYGQLHEPDAMSAPTGTPVIPNRLTKNVDPGKQVVLPPKFTPTKRGESSAEFKAEVAPSDPEPQPHPADDNTAQPTQPPDPVKRSSNFLMGIVPLALIVVFAVGFWILGRPSAPVVPTPVASPVPTTVQVAATVATAAPTPIPTLTPASTVPITDTYLLAVVASKDGDWQQAVARLQKVYGEDPNYLDVRDRLGEASQHWGTALLEQGDTAKALVQLQNAATLKPSEAVSTLITRLELYQAARAAIEGQDWKAAIDALTKLRKLDREFLGNADLLYTATMGYSNVLQKDGQTEAALQACNDAWDLKPGDQAAKACIEKLTPPPPLIFSARIFDKPTDNAVQCGTAFASHVWGTVRDQSGRGMRGAIVQVQSADRKNTFRKTTNSQGGYDVPGLGCTTWTVRLISVPIDAGELRAESVSVDINGGAFSGAGVEFLQK